MKLGHVSPAAYWNAHLGTKHGDKIEECLLHFHEHELTLRAPISDLKARVVSAFEALGRLPDRVVVISLEFINDNQWVCGELENGTPTHDAIWEYNGIHRRDDWEDVQKENCEVVAETLDNELLTEVWAVALFHMQKALYPRELPDFWQDALYANFAQLMLCQVVAFANGDDRCSIANALFLELWKSGNVPVGLLPGDIAVVLTA